MDIFLNSFALVFISEMGDKTQLLALVLAAKFRKPIPIMFGILVATLLNHALASYVGSFVTHYVSQDILKWVLSATFVGFGLWMLIPDKDDGFEEKHKWGPFLTTTVAFFFAEMGDKTQLATVALGAKYASPILVTVGTTLGMMGANGLAVIFGHRFTEKIPMRMVHRIASALFILFGIGIFFGF
ncbi:MAG: TMEM165/GDT1 family protein [Bdellovibrionaceae bacterium]|nr:TMEM165/GDT1 family protein [Pseudobdellovibrionaceae bacterium]